GNSVFSDGKLRKTMKDTREHGMFSWISRHDDFEKDKFEKDMGRVQDLYFNHGYVNAHIDEPKTELYEDNGGVLGGKKKRMRITIRVSEGAQYKVGDIKFEGNTVVPAEQLAKEFELKKGEVFNRSLLRTGLEAAQTLYGNKGYIYTSLNPVFDPKEDTKTVN